MMSYPASETWQVSRHTPILSDSSTRSRISRSSSNRPPTSLPLPAMVSSRTVVVWSGRRMSLRPWAMKVTPASVPWPTWLPGWKL